MEYIIRNADISDKNQIALTFAQSFEKDFSKLSKDSGRVAKVFESGVSASRFIIAEKSGKIIGILGCADQSGRVMRVTRKECMKYLGFIKGFIAYKVISKEFGSPLPYPKTTGFIDIVGVLQEERGKGVAFQMLKKAVEYYQQYTEFILTVTDINDTAIRVYERFGFKEFERKPYKWARLAGFKDMIYMKYIVDSTAFTNIS